MAEANLQHIEIPERQRIKLLYDRYRPQYENSLRKILRSLRKLTIKTELNITIKHRLKTFESYFSKILRHRQLLSNPILITDLIGIRIICPFLEDLNQIVALIKNNFKVLEIEKKGEKNSFREFSYDSIHLLIDLPDDNEPGTIPYVGKVCEIQLRTILQEAWAEVEHELIYKANFSLFNDSIKRKLASLNASLTLSDIIFQEIRDYQKEIEHRREKCRDDLQEKLEISKDISIIPESGTLQMEGISKSSEPIPFKPKSELEKALFDALDAHSNNNYKKAIQIYSRILRMKPKPHVRSIVYNHRGMAYFVLSNYQKSITDFTRALEYNTKNVRVYNNRGMAYRMLHQYKQALKDFKQSLDINAYQYEAYHVRALTFYDLNDFARALEDCEQALNINPEFKPAMHFKKIIESKLSI